jgi:lysophospholipase L1-like esterase
MARTSHPAAWRALSAMAIALLLFALIELVIQLRAQQQDGYSMLAVIRQENTYVIDGDTGLKLLRPNGVFEHRHVTIVSNSLGLRGPEVVAVRAADSLRIAVLGASTVMGVTEPDNEHTFAHLLEARLRDRLKGTAVEVINAGISGYTLADEQAMLERRLVPLHPDLVVLYPGFNDFGDYCLAANLRRTSTRRGLPVLELPGWWMSDDFVLKHTTSLRRTPHAAAGDKDPDAMDLSAYRAKVQSLIDAAAASGQHLVVATVARSFRRDQPRQTQEVLSAGIRASLPCFSLEGMHRLFDRHNEILAAEAREAGLPVLELDRIIPGGKTFFSNASHFAAAGEQVAADAVAEFLTAQHLLDPGAPH